MCALKQSKAGYEDPLMSNYIKQFSLNDRTEQNIYTMKRPIENEMNKRWAEREIEGRNRREKKVRRERET